MSTQFFRNNSKLRFLKYVFTLLCLLFAEFVMAQPLQSWSVKISDGAKRFQVLADFKNEAVLDKETQLVWERSPSRDLMKWKEAIQHCQDNVVAGRMGWRLLTIYERVMEKVSQFIEKKLKLKVNQEKSQVAKSDKVKFLGFTVVNGTIAIAHKALQMAMDRVKALTPRGTHKTLEPTLDKINQWYVGWSNYYSLTNYPSQLHKIEAHIRRRIRSRLVSQQKRRQFLYQNLVKRGVPPKQASKTVFSNNNRWALSNTRAVTRAYPNSWFINLKGQEIRSNRKLAHWFDVSQWIRLA